MPLAEAVKRVGSLEALLARLREVRILARHKGLYSWPGGEAVSGPGDIPPDWWAEARVDPAPPGRVIFKKPGLRIRSITLGPVVVDREEVRLPDREVFALDIRLERTAAETILPVATVSAPLKPPGRKRGAKQSAVWDPLLEHLDAMVTRGKIANPAEDAFHEARRWLEEKKRAMSDDALRKGIKRNRPKWFEA